MIGMSQCRHKPEEVRLMSEVPSSTINQLFLDLNDASSLIKLNLILHLAIYQP